MIRLDHFLQEAIETYYKTRFPFGAQGDFITAPEISQLFGDTIGIWLAMTWSALGPKQFELIEIGGGRGTLMSDILRATKNVPGLHEAIQHIYMIELSPALKQQQQTTLRSQMDYFNISWFSSLLDIPTNNTTKIIICNELFDALPIRQFVFKQDQWHETHVEGQRYELQLCPFLPIELKAALALHKPDLREGFTIEVSKAANETANHIKNLITAPSKGAALIIDYGYYDTPANSTLQAVSQHKYHDVLHNIGLADVSVLVDFKSLENTFEIPRFEHKLETQQQFLIRHGITERAMMLIKHGANEEAIESQLHRLISPEQMGSLFKILSITHA